MAQDEQSKEPVADFARLLATVTDMVRARASTAALLDAYDDACDRLIAALRDNGISDEELQSIHKALARLRLAFEEKK
jgi:hypothetical protein